ENADTSAGQIIIDLNSTINATSIIPGSGNIYVSIGPVPATPDAGTAPGANLVTNISNSGQIFYGTNSITAAAPANTLNADGGVIVFNTGSLSSSAIVLNGSNHLSVAFRPTVVLPSLDFTDPVVIQDILLDEKAGVIGGTLEFNFGVLVGGTVTVSPNWLAPTLSAENIPSGVSVTLQGFSASSPLSVDITATSHTSSVIIAGTESFLNSAGILNVTSNQAGPVLQVSGLLHADSDLSVMANGDILLSGTGAVSSGTSLSVQTITGSITQQGTTALMSAPQMVLSSAGSIGAAGANLMTQTNSLQATATGSVNIS